MRNRIQYTVKGRVQGIGYRIFVLETAGTLKLAGWVRNRDDGGVEGEAEGEAPALHSFLARLRTAHPLARIKSIEAQDLPPIDQKGFRIAR